MPVFECGALRSARGPPTRAASLEARAWPELEYAEVVDLPAGATREFDRRRERERLVVVGGEATVAGGDGGTRGATGGEAFTLDDPGGAFRVEAGAATTVVRLCGTWAPEPETGGIGVFDVATADDPDDDGDPVGYAKETGFDAHYHDCDEYWVVIEGRAVAVSEGRFYEVARGDIVATGMGHHHDVPQVPAEPLVGVYFETTMEGEKRRGHLHEHTHGSAEPKAERV
ncbi:MAG: hypothetical protein ABEH77_02215 [Halobacteriaceae archaeon]